MDQAIKRATRTFAVAIALILAASLQTALHHTDQVQTALQHADQTKTDQTKTDQAKTVDHIPGR